MNILFDLLAVQPQGNTKFHGGGEYAKTIFFELIKKNTSHKIFAVLDKNRAISKEVLDVCENARVDLLYIENKGDFQKILTVYYINVFFIGIYSSYFHVEELKNVKIIFSCLDLRMLEIKFDSTEKYYSENTIKESAKLFIKRYFPYIHRKKLANTKQEIGTLLIKANKIVTISNYSKYSILNFFPNIDEKKISVFYPEVKSVTERTGMDVDMELENYFLLIGVNRYEKNAYRAIQAFDQLFSERKLKSYRVVCVGNITDKLQKTIRNRGKFSFYGYVEAEHLESLYKNATAFIFPSLGEGFGAPPLEAMRYGTIVLASSVTSIPEICANGAIYFNPYSINEIKNKVLQVIFEDMSELKDAGIRRYHFIKKKQAESLKEIVNLILE